MRVKITSAQIIALRSAEMQEDGSYILPTAKAQTLAALARIGVVTGPRSLTVQGVSVMHTVRDVEVIASKGHTVSLSDAPESLELFTLGERVSEDVADAEKLSQADVDAIIVEARTVEITGEYVEAPDAFASMGEQTAWQRQEGVCLGLCAVGTGCEHCDSQYGPEERQKSTETVCVVAAPAGSNGMMRYHAPGCRDILREAKQWGAKEGMGMYSAAFSSVGAIIEHEYSDVENGDAHNMVWHARDDFDGLLIMPCLSIPMGDIQGMPVLMTPDGWNLGKAPLESVKCVRCEVYGDVSMPGKDVEGEGHVCGFCLANPKPASEGIEIQGYTAKAFPSVEFIGSGPSGQVAMSADAAQVQKWLSEGFLHQHTPDMIPTKHDVCTQCPVIEPHETFTRTCGTCGKVEEIEGPWNVSCVWCPECVEAGKHLPQDGGFTETMITKEYELSVMVDDSTGATVSLGWVTLTLNAAHVDDYARVAEEYGRVHGSGTPRHGWASIITVHDVCDV